MSLQGELGGSYDSSLQDSRGEIKNNNKQAFVTSGDANANEIPAEDSCNEDGGGTCKGGTGDTVTIPPLVSQTEDQDKIIIWGTDSQCDDPDLEEFELLECQELEAYLEEEGTGMFLESDSAYSQHTACSSPQMAAKIEVKGDTCSALSFKKRIAQGPGQMAPEVSSENDIIVSCISASSTPSRGLASTLDSSRRTQTVDPQHTPPEALSMTSEDTLAFLSNVATSVKSRRSQMIANPPVGSTKQSDNSAQNLNSKFQSQEVLYKTEAQPEQRYSGQRIKMSPCEGLTDSQTSVTELTSGQHEQKAVDSAITEGKPNPSLKDGFWKGHSFTTAALPGQGKDSEEDTSHQSVQPRPHTSDTGRVQNASGHSSDESRISPSAETTVHKASHKDSFRVSQSFGIPTVEQAELSGSLSLKGHADIIEGPTFDQSKGLHKQGSGEYVSGDGEVTMADPFTADKKQQLGKKSCTEPSSEAQTGAKSTGSPRRRPLSSPGKVSARAQPGEPGNISKEPVLFYNERLHPAGSSVDNLQMLNSGLKPPSKVCLSSGIPKPILQHPRTSLLNRGETETSSGSKLEDKNEAKFPPKPKHVRPKIITYIRKTPQVKQLDGAYDVATLPSRLSTYTSPLAKEPKQVSSDPKSSPVLSASNLLYDKYRNEMQKGRYYSSGLMVSGIKPPSHTVPHKMVVKSDSFYGELADKLLQDVGGGAGRTDVGLAGPGQEDSTISHLGAHEAGPASIFRSSMVLRPQLGLGAVTRLPSAKTRMLLAGQRSALSFNHPTQAASPASQCCPDPSVDQRKNIPGTPTRSHFPKPGPGGGAEEQTSQKPPVPPSETPRGPSRSSPQPPSTPATARRTLLPAQKGSPVASRKEIQKDVEVAKPAISSPKRFVVAASKPHSPVHTRQKPGAPRNAISPKSEPHAREAERQIVQKLKEKCEEQARQLLSLQEELKKATLGLEVFAITTQHFCQKSESALVKERELSLELANLRNEVAFNTARWERLQQDKEELEKHFERELRRLHMQQEAELKALEDRLRSHHRAEQDRLQAEHQALLEMISSQHQEQIEEINVNHSAAVLEMENIHTVTIAELQDEHEKEVKELKEAHELERKRLEEEFEKLRLSLQDQVDTLTFQNRSLRDRAKRFEEALRKSTDEQIEDALAPYLHIEEDLKSLKHILEMKNQQIHEQEKKIVQLEKLVEKNVVLEERVQVLQQQNEDLKARIDQNIAVSRQLSEENANLQEYVEKESNEKKRLSRTNEELLWRLQSGEVLSPRMSPSSSPVHRASPGPASPSRLNSFPR
ncbi:microtubule-associated tumor suppressor candidate 2-like isoform X2 [Lepisosteus oculatus]|uniref:microtubule-associated tumor suppressor candidate 2-like isoform X2 n=1 Tax=Lepisosteus oculatus TaxID=7918 RepID=UPI003720EFEA